MNPVIKELEGKTLGVNVPNSWIARAAAEIRRLEAELVALRLERDMRQMAEKRNAELLTAIADHVTARGEYMKQRDELLEALIAATECGMVPSSSAAEGGAAKYARQVIVADMIRSAIASVKGAAS